MKTFRIVLIVIAIFLLNPVTLIFAWFGMMAWENANPERGENQAQVDWLPETASDISFYRSYSWKAWEYSMNESDFRQWACRYDLKEIADPQEIPRFSWWEFRNTDPNQYGEAYFPEEQRHFVSVSNGLFAIDRQGNGGGYHIVFDRDKCRVYFQSNPR